MSVNKKKIINDPVYGFISISYDLLFDLIEHPYFQRLRRIKQLGLTHLVYPGALHTRFHHSLGAMHLMQTAIQSLKSKGIKINKQETKGALIAILLHDIGHGPFSHALEYSLASGINHEFISEVFMQKLNADFDGELSLGIDIFKNDYKKNFLSQLVSSQLDTDRLDYLTRDSFFTGVSEGIIGTQRIIKMLNVADDKLLVEEKGIYSIEKFIVARRIMYWQVYLHKTVLSAETMLIKILERAKCLASNGYELFATPSLHYFLYNKIDKEAIIHNDEAIRQFAMLDDSDIAASIKNWESENDPILSNLSRSLVNRKLFKCEIQKEPFDYFRIEKIKEKIMDQLNLESESDLSFFFISDTTSNYAYKLDTDKINILTKSGKVKDLIEASDQLNSNNFNKAVTKHFICYPKGIEI
jgi:HD superfamily phosphohydrolase